VAGEPSGGHHEDEADMTHPICGWRGHEAHHTGLAAVELSSGWRSGERWKREPTREAMGDGQDRRRPRISDENEGEQGSAATCAEEE
jgi:hypothetical protein